MAENVRPIPDDPAGQQVASMMDMRSDAWMMAAAGDYKAAAAEVMRASGEDWTEAIIVEWPARKNHTEHYEDVRLVMAPADAIGLAAVLLHSGVWLFKRQVAQDRVEDEDDVISSVADIGVTLADLIGQGDPK